MPTTSLFVKAGQKIRIVPDVPGVAAPLSVAEERAGEVGQVAPVATTDYEARVSGVFSVTGGTIELLDPVDFDDLDTTWAYTYTPTGKIATEAATAHGATYTKTYTYDGVTDLLTAESAWVVS